MKSDKGSTKKAKRGRQPASFHRRLLSIGLTTALALLLTLVLPFLIVPARRSQGSSFALLGLAFMIVPLVVCYNIIRSIAMPFERRLAWQKRVYLVIAGYLAMVLTYSGVYFSIAAVGDYTQANDSNFTIRYLQGTKRSEWANKSREDLVHYLRDVRPFKGMSHSLFLAIHEDPAGGYERRAMTAPDILARSEGEEETGPRLDSGAMLGLLADCVHFSIARAASAGAGDVTATSTFAKVVSDTQILATLGILVFGLGLVMSDRPKDEAEGDDQW